MSFSLKSNFPQIARESGFKLRQFKDGPLDWRLIGSVEIAKILREQQFEQVDAILIHLSEAPLASMLDSNILDSGVAKYFSLAQLGLQYMIFCRKFLDESVRTLHDKILELETQNLSLRTINQEHADNILHLHKKLSQVEAINEVVFPCHLCTKNFVSNDALNVHLSKKHFKSPPSDNQGKKNDQTLIDTIKLELEIKQLKERINVAEKNIIETYETRRRSTKLVSNSDSSTQVEIRTQNAGVQVDIDAPKKDAPTTKNFGTQCNLLEIKELDSIDAEKNQEPERKRKNSENDDNKFGILFDIQEKVSKLEQSQKSYTNGNQQSIDDLKRRLDQLTQFLESHSKQITNEQNSPSTSNQELASKSVDHFQKLLKDMFVEVSQQSYETTNRLITNIEKNYREKLSAIGTENIKKKSMQEIQLVQESHPITAEAVIENVIPQSVKATQSSEESSASDAESGSCTFTNTSLNESKHTYTSKKVQVVLDRTNTLKRVQHIMKEFGLSNNSKGLSLKEAARTLDQLSEKRRSLKQKHPTFNKTRHKLKKYVELLISEKRLNSADSKKRETNFEDKKVKIPLTADAGKIYKQRIERILSSPIKKPRSYTGKNEPVPMPRKHVMFQTEE